MTSHVQQLASAPCSCGSWVTNTGDEACLTCHGTGALVPDLWRECECFRYRLKPRLDASDIEYECSNCQGRTWVLIPPAEQRQVMEDWCIEHNIFVGQGIGYVSLLPDKGRAIRQGVVTTRNDALAHAIRQSLGVDCGTLAT